MCLDLHHWASKTASHVKQAPPLYSTTHAQTAQNPEHKYSGPTLTSRWAMRQLCRYCMTSRVCLMYSAARSSSKCCREQMYSNSRPWGMLRQYTQSRHKQQHQREWLKSWHNNGLLPGLCHTLCALFTRLSAPQWCSTHHQLPSGAVPTISSPVVQYPPSAPQWCSTHHQLPSGAVPTISSPVVQYPPSAPQWCSTHHQLPSGAVPTISLPVVQYPPSACQWCSTHHQLPSGAVPTISSPVVQYPPSAPQWCSTHHHLPSGAVPTISTQIHAEHKGIQTSNKVEFVREKHNNGLFMAPIL